MGRTGFGTIGRRAAAALALACLLPPGAARAQASATLELYPVALPAAPVPGLGLPVAEVRGLPLFDETGTIVGEVEEVLATRGGRIVALGVEVGEGLLGLGGREVIVMLAQVRREGPRLVTLLSPAQVEARPPVPD